MNKKHKELKKRVEACYKVIKEAQEELKQIREEECEHPSSREENYSWRPGASDKRQLCVVCDKPVDEDPFKIKIDESTLKLLNETELGNNDKNT